MRVFFCLSNISVPLILSVIESESTEFLIVTNQRSLHELFTILYDQEHVIYVEPLVLPNGWRKLLFLPTWFVYRYRIGKNFGHIRNSKIYFFFVAFGLLESWIIKKLSVRNRIFYSPIIDISMWSNWTGINVQVQAWYISILYGVKVTPKRLGISKYWAVSDSFLKAIDAHVVQFDTDMRLVSNLVTSKLSLQETDVLYLGGGIIEGNFVGQDEYISKNDAVLEGLSNYKILIKIHPRFNQVYSRENELQQVPSFIPANLLLDNFKVVIGYSSSVLFEAANCGCLSISLLDYFKPNNIKQKESFKDYLGQNLDSGSMIYYPRGLRELKGIIETVLKKDEKL